MPACGETFVADTLSAARESVTSTAEDTKSVRQEEIRKERKGVLLLEAFNDERTQYALGKQTLMD